MKGIYSIKSLIFGPFSYKRGLFNNFFSIVVEVVLMNGMLHNQMYTIRGHYYIYFIIEIFVYIFDSLARHTLLM